MSKPKIGVIVTSTRPTRFGIKPAKWIAELAQQSGHFDVELVDLADYPLPLFDAPASDFWMPTPNETAAKWQAKLNEFDGIHIKGSGAGSRHNRKGAGGGLVTYQVLCASPDQQQQGGQCEESCFLYHASRVN